MYDSIDVRYLEFIGRILVKFIETERIVVTRSEGREEWGINCLMSTAFMLGMMKKF